MSQVLPQQDFFMYIPEVQEIKLLPLMAGMECASVTPGEVVLPSPQAEWVKIPLEGRVVVYAHVWPVEE